MMNRIDELLLDDAKAIRANASRYEKLKPENARSSKRVFVVCVCSLLVTAAGLVALTAFRTDATLEPSPNSVVTYGELEQLAADTVQWAERVAERKQRSKPVGRVSRQLKTDRESLRRILNAFSKFGREKSNVSLMDSELAI